MPTRPRRRAAPGGGFDAGQLRLVLSRRCLRRAREGPERAEGEHQGVRLGARSLAWNGFVRFSPQPFSLELDSLLSADCLLFCLFALRCMIRRINIEVRIGLGSAFAPDGNTLEIFAEFVTFCSMLRESSFGAEQSWLPCASLALKRCIALTFRLTDTSHILSSVLSSLVRLSLASLSSRHSPSASVTSHASSFDRPATPTSSPVLLLGRLCSVLHAARDSYGWTRADAALSRAASVAERLTSAMHADAASDDYSEVIAALQSTNLAEDAGMDANGAGADDALALDALASLAGAAEEGGYGEMPAAVDGLGRLASSAGGVSMGDSLGLFGSNALELPDLEEWLNVLDQPQEWGQDVGFDASVGSGW